MSVKILVVDDEEDILDLVRLALSSEGFRVITAMDGAEALALARAESPDLILLDVSMPGIDGFEVAETLRDDPKTRRIPIIMLTARAQISDKLRGISSGAEDYITKPFEPSDLIARVRDSLRQPEPAVGRKGALQEWSGEIEQLAAHLEAASEIQQALLPKTAPDAPGFDIAGAHQSSLNVSGDFYDFIPLPNGRIGVAVADIKGKGIPAALVMVMTRTALRIVAREALPPGEALKRVNDFLAADTEPDLFATLVYAVLDPNRREFTYSNGGHCYPILVEASGATRTLETGGSLVGAFDEAEFEAETITLSPGDRAALYTDGVTETMNAAGELFGEQRLSDLLRDSASLTAEQMCDRVRVRLSEHRGSAKQTDDMTIVAIHARP